MLFTQQKHITITSSSKRNSERRCYVLIEAFSDQIGGVAQIGPEQIYSRSLGKNQTLGKFCRKCKLKIPRTQN